MNDVKRLIDKLEKDGILLEEEFVFILSNNTQEVRKYAASKAAAIKEKHFGNKVFVRGLIEFSNYCKNDCYYCGIRKSNSHCDRYRLTLEDILNCCDTGYQLGYRTFVLQSGEDPYFTDSKICEMVSLIKNKYPDVAVTLSIGEKSEESYKAYKDAGADRFLLRHETSNSIHYSKLHPDTMSIDTRKDCLRNLVKLRYQVGAGFMVGSPYQTKENIAEDLIFLYDLKPHMIGIGPFISHKDTPFADKENGTLEETLLLLSLIRIMLPDVLLPSTTALGTINPRGREMGLLSGANVVMPNLSPVKVRQKYSLYDNKICTGEEAAECVDCLKKRVELTGNIIVTDRGDSPRM